MHDIEYIHFVKANVLEDFKNECIEIIKEQQEQYHRVVNVEYKPLLSEEKRTVIHTAMITARRIN